MDPVFWSMAGDRIVDVYNIAFIGMIVGLLITIASAIALLWSASSRTRLEQEKLAAVSASAEMLKQDVMRANDRATQLAQQAKQAAAERERAVSEQAKPQDTSRHITPEQKAKFVKALEGHKFEITLLASDADPEAKRFGDELSDALTEAGLKVTRTHSLLGLPVQGIGMSMSHATGASFLYMALRNAGLSISDLPEKDPPMIVVGSRPSANPAH